MSLRPIFFDVDGVLIHGYHSDPAKQVRWDATLEEDLGVNPDAFRKHFIFDVFVDRVIIGELSVVDALEQKLPLLGYKDSPLHFLHYWLSKDSRLNSELLDHIVEIKRKTDHSLFIATNQEHVRANWLWQGLGLAHLFDDMFYSARLGVKKPDPAYFAAIENRLGGIKDTPLFFDDTPAVVESARACGWEAVTYNSLTDVTDHRLLSPHFQ